MNGYYKQVVEQLKKNGYSYLRPAGGAHEMWAKGSHHQTVSSNCASRHTANGIMKQAGIAHRF